MWRSIDAQPFDGPASPAHGLNNTHLHRTVMRVVTTKAIPEIVRSGIRRNDLWLSLPHYQKNHIEELHDGHTQNYVHRKFQPSP